MASSSATTSVVPLYGGALSVALPTSRADKPSVPIKFLDMSNFRQVPDHQEVHSDVDSGCVVIVELLGTADNVGDSDCAAYYFKDLAECNGCTMGANASLSTTAVLTDADTPNFPATVSSGAPCGASFKCSSEGYQVISKFTNEDDRPNKVYVGMVVVRLPPPVATDLVVSVSVPIEIHPQSSEAKNVTPATIMTMEEAQRVLRCVASSLKVERWSLFV